MSTKISKPFNVRTPIRLRIFLKENDELIYTARSTKKSKIRVYTRDWLEQNEDLNGMWYGKCRVLYHSSRKLWNESIFTSYQQFDKALSDDTEKALLMELKRSGDIEPKYLMKRKQKATEKQLAALQKNQFKKQS